MNNSDDMHNIVEDYHSQMESLKENIKLLKVENALLNEDLYKLNQELHERIDYTISLKKELKKYKVIKDLLKNDFDSIQNQILSTD